MRARQPSLLIQALAGVVQGVALFAMLLQVTFYADHIGASAVRALGGVSPDSRFGILEICTGEGVAKINADGTLATGASDCPICENASMAAFGTPLALPPIVFPVIAVAELRVEPVLMAVADQRFPGSKPIRGPPAQAC